MAKLVSREGNTATIEFIIKSDDFKRATTEAYNKTKGRYNIPGFRKGKAPRRMIENAYGEGVFYEEALNIALQPAYEAAIEELKLDVVSRPDVDVKTFEPEKDIEIEAKVDLMPEVELPDYKDLEVKFVHNHDNCEAGYEEKFEEELKRQQELNSRLLPVEGRKTENGDVVNIDFVGKMDGVAFEGGTGENFNLELGSGSFIPGFESQLEGKDKGDEVEVKVTFPEDYRQRDLAGKEAIFEVKINDHKLKDLPKADDDFISEISEFDTLADYKADFIAKAKKEHDEHLEFDKKNAAIKALADITVIDIPESMIDMEVQRSVYDIEHRFRHDGFSLEKYFELTGMTMEKLEEQMRPSAEVSVKNKLVINALVEKLNPEVTQEDIDKEIEAAAKYSAETTENIKKYYEEHGYDGLKEHLKVQKALAGLVEDCKFELIQADEEELLDQDVLNAELEKIED